MNVTRAMTVDGHSAVPREWSGYNRSAATIGIVHFGVGAFHRAHLAEYIDDALRAGDTDWAICGVGLLPEDRPTLQHLRDQDCLYSRTVKHADGTWVPRQIGSIVDVVFAPDDPSAVLARLREPAVRIVSLTVTEGGYLIDELTGEFDLGAEAIQNDLHGDNPPSTIFGYLVDGLAERRRAGMSPFTILSCDNVPANGDTLRRGVLAVAERREPDVVTWIADSVCFPNSMVDRITPGTVDADRYRLRDDFGVLDEVPVVCEPFKQWVIEDRFSSGRPRLELSGALFVRDVGPFEGAKLRMLNGGHQALAHLGRLAGHEFVHEACTDPILMNFLLAYLAEVQPTLPRQNELDLNRYARQLIARFSNPQIADPLARIRAHASDRVPKWVVPAILENVAAGREATFGAVVLAAWRCALRSDAALTGGDPIPDRRTDHLSRLVADGRNATDFLADRDLFGSLADNKTFVQLYCQATEYLEDVGVARGVLAILQDELFSGPVPVDA